MCHEILTAGGMNSVLTLFKASRQSTELMMVSALTAVYLLPALLDSGNVQGSTYIYMGVIECLRFLIDSSRENIEIDISPSEVRTASAFTMTNLWFKVLVPKLRSTDVVLANNVITRGSGNADQDPFASKRFYSRRRSSLSSRTGEDFDCSILTDAFTSLSVMAAVSEASRRQEGMDLSQVADMSVYYEFALIIESICK